MPAKRPSSSKSGVLNHSQVIVRPSLVRFSLTECASMSPAPNTGAMISSASA